MRGLSSHFVWTNRSKESLTLDFRQEAGRAILHRLVMEHADVVVQNLAPGAAARLGLSHAALAARKPGIIVCDISGYGADGPLHDRKAYDLLIQGEAGLLSVTGTEETQCKAGPSIADIAAGMYAYSTILAALLHRKQTGRGQHLDISMLESMCEWMSYPLNYAFEGASPPPRTGAAHATIYPYGLFKAGCGGSVLLAVQNDREWMNFCRLVLLQAGLAEDARFASNSARNTHRDILDEIISEAFQHATVEMIMSRLLGANIATARVNTMQNIWDHEQLRSRNRWREIGSPAGPLPALLPPGSWPEDEPRMDPVPSLGEHTDAILIELGLSKTEIQDLRGNFTV